ncbi:MAG: 6-bladed beta-propeller, partial [Ignavibacteria bacterium]
GNYLFTFGGKGREDGNFWMPCGIFIDGNNHIYIADKYNSRIQEYRLLYGR